MLDLEPIKARLAAATPGPWIYRNTCEIWDPERPVCEIEGASVVPLDNDVKVLPYGQDLNLIVNAPRDLAALIAEVERLRRQRAVDQDQIRSYARALNWYAEPANWVEKIDDRGRDKLSFRWADDDGHMARWALSRWQQNEAEKKD